MATDSDVKNGKWLICLDSVVIKFEKDYKKSFSFCVKTNFIEQTHLNKQGKLDVLYSCFGVFSCKGLFGEEVVVKSSNQNWFLINNLSSYLKVLIHDPFTHDKLIIDASIACYFLYKRVN